jgi:hypothetical protein
MLAAAIAAGATGPLGLLLLDLGGKAAVHANDYFRSVFGSIIAVVFAYLGARVVYRLGREVSFFAYPYGRMTPPVQHLVRQHFDGACSTELRLAQATSDRHCLPRIEMYYFSRNELFHSLGRPPFHRYIAWRRALRGVRRLWAT